jgi:hypothetical protein
VTKLEGNPVLVVASESELPPTQRVWGSGDWLPSKQREALDWLTLARLLGWGVDVRWVELGLAAPISDFCHWIIIACDPSKLNEEWVEFLMCVLKTRPVLVVAQAGTRECAFSRLARTTMGQECVTGRSLSWIGPAPHRRWDCRKLLMATGLELAEEATIWATLAGVPVIAARRLGEGVIASLGFHPSEARDTDGAATRLLKHLLICGSRFPVAWLDLEGSLVLRMDDPGGAQNIYLRSYAYPKLGEWEWARIGNYLRRRNGRLSISYVTGWIDDGDAARGTLTVNGDATDRIAGLVHPSPFVKYDDIAGHAPGTTHDYQAEFRGIQGLRKAGLGEVELHGYTHIHPDTNSWIQAPDRYEAIFWYRELGKSAQATIDSRAVTKHPLALAIDAFHRHFDVHPSTLICPGDEWTDAVLERALDLDLQLTSGYFLAIRDGEGFCWAQHVWAPYLDQAGAAWFDSGLPVVGYFHDRDVAVEGVEWMINWLDRWQDAGAKKFMDFRELAAALGRRLYLSEQNGELRLNVTSNSAPQLVRPLTICVRAPGGRVPSHITVASDYGEHQLDLHSDSEGLGWLTLPDGLDGTIL